MPNPSNEKPQGTSPEAKISPEALVMLNSTLEALLEALPIKDVEKVDDFEVKHYDSSIELPQSGGYLNLHGMTLHHQQQGLLSRTMLYVSHGSGTIGPEMSDDFNFYISDKAIWTGEPVIKIDDETGEITSGVDEVMTFTDQQARDTRLEELLEDPSFSPTSSLSSVYVPDFQLTPSGEIYEDGQEMHVHKQVGAVGVSLTLKFKDDQEAASMQRWEAAYAQVRREIGPYMTDDRAERVIDLMSEAHSNLS